VKVKIDATTQGEKSVHQYVAELRSLWTDLNHYDLLCLHNPTMESRKVSEIGAVLFEMSVFLIEIHRVLSLCFGWVHQICEIFWLFRSTVR
jgi:hypothetical protein